MNVTHKTIKFIDGVDTFLHIFSNEEFLNDINEKSIDNLAFNGTLQFSVSSFNHLNHIETVIFQYVGSPILIYLHGGYWQWGSVSSSSFMAGNFTKKGITVIALGYDIAPLCKFNYLERFYSGLNVETHLHRKVLI